MPIFSCRRFPSLHIPTGRHITTDALLSAREHQEMAAKIRAPRHRLRNTVSALPRLQIYVSQSLSELAERLVECSKEEKGQSLTSKTRDIVYVLKTHKLRHTSNAHTFRGTNGVGALLSLLSLCAGREGRDRGLLLSTLGNLCALDKDTRTQVGCWEREGEVVSGIVLLLFLQVINNGLKEVGKIDS